MNIGVMLRTTAKCSVLQTWLAPVPEGLGSRQESGLGTTFVPGGRARFQPGAVCRNKKVMVPLARSWILSILSPSPKLRTPNRECYKLSWARERNGGRLSTGSEKRLPNADSSLLGLFQRAGQVTCPSLQSPRQESRILLGGKKGSRYFRSKQLSSDVAIFFKLLSIRFTW